MTEAEAKTKTCPAMLAGAQNRSPLCIASSCMAWRTRPVRSHERQITASGIDLAPPKDTVTLDGFCGLAGAPQ